MHEKIYWQGKPSGKVVISWIFTFRCTNLPIVLLVSYLFIIWRLGSDSSIVKLLSFSIAKYLPFLIVILILYLIYSAFLWKTYDYSITENGISFKGGIIERKELTAPYHKITDVEVSQNIIERMLGISKIGFQTAGTGGRAKAEITFEGLIDVNKPKEIVGQFVEKISKSKR